jgi:hypothetical protein
MVASTSSRSRPRRFMMYPLYGVNVEIVSAEEQAIRFTGPAGRSWGAFGAVQWCGRRTGPVRPAGSAQAVAAGAGGSGTLAAAARWRRETTGDHAVGAAASFLTLDPASAPNTRPRTTIPSTQADVAAVQPCGQVRPRSGIGGAPRARC